MYPFYEHKFKYSLRTKILVLEMDKMEESITKISLDTTISRTSISEWREYMIALKFFFLLLSGVGSELQLTEPDGTKPLWQSCDVVAVLRFIGLRRIDEEGKDFEL